MAEHPNAVAVRRLFEAFRGGDISQIDDVIDPAVVWHFPGRKGRLAGDHRGRDEIFEFLALVLGLTDGTFSFDVIDVLANDRRAVVLFRGTGVRGDRMLDNPTCLSMRLQDGRVVELWEFVWDLYHVEDFWS